MVPHVRASGARPSGPVPPVAPTGYVGNPYAGPTSMVRRQQSSAPYYYGPQVPGARNAPDPTMPGPVGVDQRPTQGPVVDRGAATTRRRICHPQNRRPRGGSAKV
ncbi:MAG: hypothetical protein ABI360_07655 [Allobranchiibius sp.]